MKIATDRLDGVFTARQRVDRIAALVLADHHKVEPPFGVMHFHKRAGDRRAIAIFDNSLQRARTVLRVYRLGKAADEGREA